MSEPTFGKPTPEDEGDLAAPRTLTAGTEGAVAAPRVLTAQAQPPIQPPETEPQE